MRDYGGKTSDGRGDFPAGAGRPAPAGRAGRRQERGTADRVRTALCDGYRAAASQPGAPRQPGGTAVR